MASEESSSGGNGDVLLIGKENEEEEGRVLPVPSKLRGLYLFNWIESLLKPLIIIVS
jgi:hypothetical protein